jgi:hypothetical protein
MSDQGAFVFSSLADGQAMYLLKEEIRTIPCPRDYAATYDLLLSKLEDLRLPIEKADQSKGIVLATCISRLINMGFWRCWSDKLLFEIKKVSPGVSSISVYGIPNLLRMRVKSGETVIDLDAMVSHLADACR